MSRRVGDCYKRTTRKLRLITSYFSSARMLKTLNSFWLICSFLAICAQAKIYDRCELARELRDTIKVPEEQLATWVCIAQHESRFDTSVIGTLAEGKDNGIFQISDLYWCEWVRNLKLSYFSFKMIKNQKKCIF